jgi:hypothetical protein
MLNAEQMIVELHKCIPIIEKKMKESKGKWVVASENHIYVGPKKGINGCGFNVRNVFAVLDVVLFDTEEQAGRRIDPYLVYPDGKPMYNLPTPAPEFFQLCLKDAQDSLSLLENAVNYCQQPHVG